MADTADSPTELRRSARTQLRRKRERGSHDRSLVHAVLDEGLVCHVGVCEGGAPKVLPTTYARVGDVVYLHGAPGNHVLRTLAAGAEACLTVTLLDGVVLARSAFHHSMNYRSVVLFGVPRRVEDPAEKRAAVAAVVDHVAPGRSADARPPTDAELTSTLVVAFPIGEGSAKVRRGGPLDDDADLGLAVWAGVVPLETVSLAPVPDGPQPGAQGAPAYAADYIGNRTRTLAARG
jgi:uncharacterized protein